MGDSLNLKSEKKSGLFRSFLNWALSASQVHGSISKNLLVWILTVGFAFGLIATGIQVFASYMDEVSDISDRFTEIENSHIDVVSTHIYYIDKERLLLSLNGFLKFENFIYIEVNEQRNGQIIKTFVGDKNYINNHLITKTFPIVHKETQKNLGSLFVAVNAIGIYKRIAKYALIVISTNFLKALASSLIIYMVLNHLLTKHLIDLTQFTRRLFIQGLNISDFKLNRENPNYDELDQLTEGVNVLKNKLRNTMRELEVFNSQLEAKVAEQTEDLRKSNLEITEANDQLNKKLEKIQAMQKQLIAQENLASLGTLAAGIAHEIKNPLNIVISY